MTDQEKYDELFKKFYSLIKDMQQIEWLCKRAKRFEVEEKDIDEILAIAQKELQGG